MTTRKATAPKPAPTTAALPDTKRIETASSSLAVQAKKIAVKDEQSYLDASTIIDTGNAILKQVGETFDPLIKSAHEHHKQLIATKRQFTDPVDSALTGLKRQMSAFHQEKERLRRLEEARLQQEAKKQQEEAAQEEAAALEAQGDHEAAEAVVNEAIAAPAPAVSLPKFNAGEFGRQTRSVWKWEIVDLAKIPVEFLTVSQDYTTKLNQCISTTQIGALVRTIKNKELAEAKFKGGVRVWEDTTVI